MFDPICKYLAEHFSADFATWLLGKEISLSALAPSELSLEPIRADALIMLEGDENLLHIEFQTQPEPKIPFRMLDYWVIQLIPDRKEQANLVASTFVLAGLVLEESVIQRVLQMDILAESPTYQYIINKGVEKGREEGREEGRLEERRAFIIKLLNLKLGELSESITDQVSQLSFPQLEQLGEAMLTFSTVEELTQHISSVQTQAADNATDGKP